MHTCMEIRHNQSHFLVDCGAGSFSALMREQETLPGLDGMLLTHFHGDHMGGISYILMYYLFVRRLEKPFEIWTPKGGKGVIKNLSESLYPGLGLNLVSQENLSFHEFEDLPNFEAFGVQIKPEKVIHAPNSRPHGFRIDLGAHTLAFSGDTEWTDNLIELSAESDLFVCECNNDKTQKPGHIHHDLLVEKATFLSSKKVILNHLGPDMLLKDSKDSPFEFSYDGLKIDL